MTQRRKEPQGQKRQKPERSEPSAPRAGASDNRPTAGKLARVFGSPWLAILILLMAVLATYANSLRCPFIFDDVSNIIDNASIRHLWPLWDVFLVRSESAVGLQTRPVVNLTFALDYAVDGLNTLPYHVTNLAIHMLAGLALFGVVRRTLLLPKLRDRFGRASVPLALATALLWAVHPLQTESVSYVTQRYESLMGLFYLVAVYAAIRSSDSTHPYFWGAVTATATLLSLGCKEVAVSLPIVILLYDRVMLAGSFSELWRRRWGMYLALLAAWAAFAVLQLRAGPRPWAGYALPVSWFEYARSQPGIILHYLRLVFWPYPLVLDYGWRPAHAGEILPGAIVVAGLLVATGYAFWRWPAWGLLGAWFFLILTPTSSVMPLADLAFEHRMYLPLAAVVVGVVLGTCQAAQWLAHRGTISPAVLWIAGGGLAMAAVIVLGIVAFRRNLDYQTKLAIWQDTLANVPGNGRAHYNLGIALADDGQVDEAIAQFQKALEINPNDADAHGNLGNVLAACRRANEAFAEYEAVLSINPNDAKAHFNLGIALADRGQVDEAIAHFRTALEISPNDAVMQQNLGLVLAGHGQVNEAIAHFQKALEINPNFVDAHGNLGNILAAHGRVDEAIAHYRAILRINPNDVATHYILGAVLARRGEVDEAIAHFQKAVEINPDYLEAQFNLGLALDGCGRPGEAIAHYEKALILASARNDSEWVKAIRSRITLLQSGLK